MEKADGAHIIAYRAAIWEAREYYTTRMQIVNAKFPEGRSLVFLAQERSSRASLDNIASGGRNERNRKARVDDSFGNAGSINRRGSKMNRPKSADPKTH